MILRTLVSETVAILGCPSASATALMRLVSSAGYQSSAGCPHSLGGTQAFSTAQSSSASVISAGLPRPGASARAAPTPPASYFETHRVTVDGSTSILSATSAFVRPAAFSSRILALT